jgi:uncharacterized protein (UPF0276 family)
LNRRDEGAEGADCAILLDINIYVSSVNHGFDPERPFFLADAGRDNAATMDRRDFLAVTAVVAAAHRDVYCTD